MRMRNRTKVAFLQLNRRDFSFFEAIESLQYPGTDTGLQYCRKKPIQKRKVFFSLEKIADCISKN